MTTDTHCDYECTSLNHLHLLLTHSFTHLLQQDSLYNRKNNHIDECWLNSIGVHLQFNSFQSNTIQYHIIHTIEVVPVTI